MRDCDGKKVYLNKQLGVCKVENNKRESCVF